jgi:hypothetical protein
LASRAIFQPHARSSPPPPALITGPVLKLRQRRDVDEELLIGLAGWERSEQPRLGARKLRVLLEAELAQAGVRIGRDRFFGVLRKHDLLLEPGPSQTPRTTQSYHTLPVFQELDQGAPGQPGQ